MRISMWRTIITFLVATLSNAGPSQAADVGTMKIEVLQSQDTFGKAGPLDLSKINTFTEARVAMKNVVISYALTAVGVGGAELIGSVRCTFGDYAEGEGRVLAAQSNGCYFAPFVMVAPANSRLVVGIKVESASGNSGIVSLPVRSYPPGLKIKITKP